MMSSTLLSRRAFATLSIGGMLVTGLLLLGTQEAGAQIMQPPPPAFPPLVQSGYYYSAMILPRPGFRQEGVAMALGKHGGGPVIGAAWTTASTTSYKAAKFDGPYALHPYPQTGPNPYVSSIAYALCSINFQTKQAGVAWYLSNPDDPKDWPKPHAFLWNDSNQSYVDLHPAGWEESYVYGGAGTAQVGMVYRINEYRAARWRGTTASFTDMHPTGMFESSILGTDGSFHVGRGEDPITGQNHALLWSDAGNQVSFMDLHPTGPVPSLVGPRTFKMSVAYAIDNGQQVGIGADNIHAFTHALIWDGTSASARSLHPADTRYWESGANGLAHNVAAGWGVFSPGGGAGSRYHALAWHGVRAESFFDLHDVLPPGYWSSGAKAVGGYGDIVGYAETSGAVTVPVRWMYRRKVTNPPYEFGPREDSFPVSRRRGEGFIITEVKMPKEGGIVKMTSDSPSLVSVPESVMIGGEEDAAIFTMTFAPEGMYPKGTVKSVTLRATHAGKVRTAIVKVIF